MPRHYPLIRFSLSLTTPLAALAMVSALLVLTAYPLHLNQLIRPVLQGPGSHPLTASCVLLLGMALMAKRGSWQGLLLAMLALLLCLARLLLPSEAALSALVPFKAELDAINQLGRPVSFGFHSAFCLGAAAAGVLAYHRFLPRISQLFALLSFAVPQVAMTGYAFGLERFYGEMSVTTVLMATPLSVAVLLKSAHRGGVRAILSPWAGGRVARVQLLLGMAIPFLLGLFLVNTAKKAPDVSFGLLIVSVSQAMAMLIATSAILYEQMDRGRRNYHRQLERLATRDPLTGAFNRYALERRAEVELARSRRHGHPLSVLIVDADHFKRINDTHGHGTGDKVLSRLALLLQSHSRREDVVARWGGEEFVLLLPDTPARNAVAVAQKMRAAIANADFTDLAERLEVTISVGAAELLAKESISDLLRRADMALYQAKDGGRNKVCKASPQNAAMPA